MSLTSDQLESVSRVFEDDVSSGISPRKKRVVALMKTDPTLRKVVNSTDKVKKVTDRVRHLLKSRPTVEPFELPEYSASERTAKHVE